jgi:uncharacterized membrane protein YbhN (UPF0104 family)
MEREKEKRKKKDTEEKQKNERGKEIRDYDPWTRGGLFFTSGFALLSWVFDIFCVYFLGLLLWSTMLRDHLSFWRFRIRGLQRS